MAGRRWCKSTGLDWLAMGGLVVYAWASGPAREGGRLVLTIGFTLIGLGLGMMLVGKSSSERNGYRF